MPIMRSEVIDLAEIFGKCKKEEISNDKSGD